MRHLFLIARAVLPFNAFAQAPAATRRPGCPQPLHHLAGPCQSLEMVVRARLVNGWLSRWLLHRHPHHDDANQLPHPRPRAHHMNYRYGCGRS
jgi:hypothetical protein